MIKEKITITKQQSKKLISKRDKVYESVKMPISEQFIYTVKVCGTGSHISLPRRWLGRTVIVKIEEVIDDDAEDV